MPSTPPYVPTWDFATDPDPANMVNATSLQTQLRLIAAWTRSIDDALSRSIRDDNTLTDELVRLRNLHPEVSDYIDTALSGTIATQALAYRTPVKAATTENLNTLFDPDPDGPITVDGVTLGDGDRILLKNQTTKSQNGIWIVHEVPNGPGGVGLWERATDMPVGESITAPFGVWVTSGDVNGGTSWALQAGGTPLTVATSSLTFFVITGWPHKYTTTITGDGVEDTFVITHNLNTLSIVPSIRDGNSFRDIGGDGNIQITRIDNNSIRVTFDTPPSSTLRVTVIG
jgi:hypothetical protein